MTSPGRRVLGDFRSTIRDRARSDPAFAEALREEIANLRQDGTELSRQLADRIEKDLPENSS